MHTTSHSHMTTNGKALQVDRSAIKPSTIPVIKRQRQNWLDAPSDDYFIATEETRKFRKQFTRSQLKRASRTPCAPITVTTKSLVNHRLVWTEPATIMH
ncbi:metastasis-associated protein MTA1-like [Lepidochelys kempii]|uniref:metastasis-associated protein MTA1-like n=1 Tax=Lepidochelys kempii TaxID=8472 RepID=UPI003C704AF8